MSTKKSLSGGGAKKLPPELRSKDSRNRYRRRTEDLKLRRKIQASVRSRRKGNR